MLGEDKTLHTQGLLLEQLTPNWHTRLLSTITKQAEAKRARRAKVIHAEGEEQASVKLLTAAQTLAQQPQALQLRYLQTLTENSAEKNSTIVFPLPMDLIAPLVERLQNKGKTT